MMSRKGMDGHKRRFMRVKLKELRDMYYALGAGEEEWTNITMNVVEIFVEKQSGLLLRLFIGRIALIVVMN